MGVPTILTPELVQRIKEKYEERNALGRRVNSMMKIGKELGISETTVLRAVKSLGAYKDAPPIAGEQDWKRQAEESAQRLMALLESPEPAKPRRDYQSITPVMRERLIGYQQWTEEDEKAWQASHSKS